jgi:Fe-S-cluster containining protein
MSIDDSYAHSNAIGREPEINDDILSRIEQLKYLQRTFECRRCGECCKQESIAFTERDIERISDKLILAPQEFIQKYDLRTVNNPGELLFYQLHVGTRERCPFNSDRECTIYDARPQVCRGFPFLTPGNVENAFRLKNEIVLGSNCREAIDQMDRVLKNPDGQGPRRPIFSWK